MMIQKSVLNNKMQQSHSSQKLIARGHSPEQDKDKKLAIFDKQKLRAELKQMKLANQQKIAYDNAKLNYLKKREEVFKSLFEQGDYMHLS